MSDEFPPNSLTARDDRAEKRSAKDAPEKKEVQRIVKGRVVQRKKPLHKKFIEAFRPEDNVGFLEHMILDVAVPSIKDGIAFITTEAIENALGTSGTRSRRSRGSGYTSYNRMSDARPRSRRDRDDDKRPSRRDRDRDRDSGPNVDQREWIVESRVEAEEIVDALIELISKYDQATMRDLLSMLGEQHTYTDEDWGWTDLRGARIHRIGRDGYLLDLPRAEPLD